MDRNLKLFAVFSVLLFTTMCTFYDQSGAVVSSNGLSCQTQTDFGVFERQQFSQCYYQCPDGKVSQPEIAGEFSASSPLYSASKEELDAQFCDGALQPTRTRPPATVSPTSAVATTESTVAPPTAPPTEQASPSATAEISTTEQPPLLRGDVTMCDVAVNLINFRMIDPVPDLTGKTLVVRIADQPSTCSVNPVNTSLLTCTIPPSVTFPNRVVVRLDDAVVNDFVYDGLGCAKIATVLPTTTP